MPAIVRWSRSSGCRWRGASSSAANSSAGGRRPGVRAERGHRLVGRRAPPRAAASPRRAAGCRTRAAAARGRPSSRISSREARSRSDARLSHSCRRPADIRWTSSDQLAGVDDQHLADPPHARRSSVPASASSGGSNVFIVTMPGASADSIVAPAAARDEAARGDLDLGQLGHRPKSRLLAMRISVAADERTGVADAVVGGAAPARARAAPARRAGRPTSATTGPGPPRPPPATWPRAAPSRPSSAAGPAPARRSPPTRSAGVRAALCARRRDRPRRAPLERRQRARAVAAHDQPGAARGDPRRLVRGGPQRRRRTTWPTSATWTRSSAVSGWRSGSRTPGMKRKKNVAAPSRPETASVVRAPSTSATGPVTANDSGVRPIETNQSKLDTRPSSSGGTSVFISVFQTTSAAVPRPNERNATRHICHAASADGQPDEQHVADAQAAHMNVTWRRGMPVRPISTAPTNEPAPPPASTVPNVAAPPSRSLRMMYGSSTSNGPNVNSRNSAAPTSVPHSQACART